MAAASASCFISLPSPWAMRSAGRLDFTVIGMIGETGTLFESTSAENRGERGHLKGCRRLSRDRDADARPERRKGALFLRCKATHLDKASKLMT